MVYETSIIGEASREKCFYFVTDFCFGGLPLLGRLVMNHPVDICVQKTAQSFCLHLVILDNGSVAEGGL